MARYKSTREKVKEMIESSIFQAAIKAGNQDIPDGLIYESVIIELVTGTGCTRKVAEEMLSMYLQRGDLTEERVLFATSKILSNSNPIRREIVDEVNTEIKEVLEDVKEDGK